MNIDKRYLEILANNYPYKINRWYGILATLGYGIFIFGLLCIITNDKTSTALLMGMHQDTFGTILALMGLALILVMMILKGGVKKKLKVEFLDFYEKTGAFMPWPEPVKKDNIPPAPQRPL